MISWKSMNGVIKGKGLMERLREEVIDGEIKRGRD